MSPNDEGGVMSPNGKNAMTGANPRLCLITHARFPIGEPRAERAARAAGGEGYRVDVIALRGEGEPAHERLDGITVWRLPIRHRRGAPLAMMALEYCSFTILAGLWALALRARGKIAVVEVHSPPEFLILAGLLPKLLGARLLLDVRDLSSHLWEARFGALQRDAIVIGLLRRLERVACALADAVVTVHDPYKAQLTARGAEERRIAVVMNAPEESLIAGVKRSPASLGDGALCDGEFTVAYHGTITRWYGVDLLVQAIGLLRAQGRQARAVILGEGDQLETVRELAAELGVGDSVSFSNRYLPIEEALRAVAGTDCGIISNRPSEINRFILPNKLFEYVALGIPVVSARLETVAAHFDDDDLTFCRPGDPASLAGAIAWVMDERAAAMQKSVRAQARAELYRWDRSRISYLDVLHDLQTGSVGAPA
jgi:glycosyltransferase involved in cell wall biosynthesis